jgi:Homeodomain-like domain
MRAPHQDRLFEPKYPDSTRRQALDMLERGKSSRQVGAELGVPPSTIRVWRSQEKQATKVASQTWAEQADELWQDTFRTAKKTLKELDKLLKSGPAHAQRVKNLSMAEKQLGHCVAGFRSLANELREAEERLATEHAAQLAARVRALVDDLDLPLEALGPVLRSRLEENAEPDPEELEAAKRSLRVHVLAQVPPEELEAASRLHVQERPALPPGPPPHPDAEHVDVDEEPEEMAGPVKRLVSIVRGESPRGWRTAREIALAEEQEPDEPKIILGKPARELTPEEIDERERIVDNDPRYWKR